MDLYLLTTATDKSAAAVTSTTDDTPVTSLENLVLGDTPLINARFTNGTAAPAWAGAAGYTLYLSLGIPDVNGQAEKTSVTSTTAISGGWSARLPLTTQELIDALALNVGSAVQWTRYPMQTPQAQPRPYGGYFTLQVMVKETATGYEETYGLLRVFLRNRVLP